jgi:N-terminal acetyltransferase 2
MRGYTSLAQDSPPPSPGTGGGDDAKLPLTTRLKILIKSYGWYALGVYFVLTVVDFSIAFAAVNLLGAAQVGRATAYVKGAVLDMIHGAGIGVSSEDSPDSAINGRESANGGAGGNEGLYAMIVLAYTVHKTLFMPIRVGLTMAITPKLVRWLRTRGFTGQGGATRAAGQLRQNMRRKAADRTD